MVYILALLCILLAILLVWRVNQERKTYRNLEHMLEAASKGENIAEHYDEQQLSKLETKWRTYLMAAAASGKNVERERHYLKELISDISHQTKTPLANILLYTELLAERLTGAEEEELLMQIQRQSRKLSFLIDALVKTSRLESGMISVEPRNTSVIDLLQKIVAEANPAAGRKNIELEIDGGSTDTISACFDLKWTLEAVGNIVDNAIKYSPADSKIIIKSTEYELFVRIDICDQGLGIAEEERGRIFERFYRGSAVKDQEGVGVGLYLAREIIMKQGGYIKVGDGKETGTEFSVFLSKILPNC